MRDIIATVRLYARIRRVSNYVDRAAAAIQGGRLTGIQFWGRERLDYIYDDSHGRSHSLCSNVLEPVRGQNDHEGQNEGDVEYYTMHGRFSTTLNMISQIEHFT